MQSAMTKQKVCLLQVANCIYLISAYFIKSGVNIGIANSAAFKVVILTISNQGSSGGNNKKQQSSA